MLPSQHVFSHQHQYQAEPSWLHQQQSQHHQQQHHQGQLSHQHAQAQAAAAVAAVAQQNHYHRITANSNNNSGHGHGGHTMGSDTAMANGPDGNFSDENRRVLVWVAELLNGSSRETALMELSKKREQVSELALIIWHSFGKTQQHLTKSHQLIQSFRRYDFAASRDHFGLPSPQSFPAYRCRFESRLQCPCPVTMCGLP